MIELTRLNGSSMVLNSDLIKTAEASPDTMLTLINGEKLIVREELGEVVERVLAYRARLLATVAPRLSAFDDLPRVVSLTSVNVPDQDMRDQSVPLQKAPQRDTLRNSEG
ncbi:MAG: flagellar FlbD family protein [Terracidiphilus sp.]